MSIGAGAAHGEENRRFAAILGHCQPTAFARVSAAVPRRRFSLPGKGQLMTACSLHRRRSIPFAPHRGLRSGHAATLLLFLALATPVAAEEADPLVARINGTEIRASDLAIADEDVGSNLPMTGQERRDYLTKYLSDMILVAQAAEAQKMQDRADFKHRLAYARDKLLMDMLLQQAGKASISEDALHQLYEEAKKQMAGEKEVHARHILVETEEQAKAIVAELKKGGDFAAIARERSKDPAGQNGGDLGYFTKDQMVPEFAQAAFKLEAGQLSDPVKTQFGWHIIRVEEKRDRPIPEFDKVRDQLENFLARRSQADLVNKLRGQANIETVEAAPELVPLPAPGTPKQK